MDKELKFQTQFIPRQTDPAMKRRKRSEAQIQQWEIIRRQSTIIEDKELNIDGMVRLTLSRDTQESLGCMIGNQVTSESPWTNVKKATIIAHLTAKRTNSEIYQFKDIVTGYKCQEFLIGYIFTAEKPNQFYICLTEEAKKNALELIRTNRIKYQMRVQSCICREVRQWTSLDSGKEVEESTHHHTRPLLEIETISTALGLRTVAKFQNRDPDDTRDGYVHFEPKKFTTVTRKRVDVAIQAVPEICLSIAQTVPPLPSNVWTQYEYHVDIQQEVSQEIAKNIKQFVQENSPQMTDLVRYNSVFDLYKDDYPNLVKSECDIQIPKKMIYESYQSFMDVKYCKGKIISAAAWHPMWMGVMACAYVNQVATDEEKDDDDDDYVLRDMFSISRVLVWNFSDSLNPQLVLGSLHDVHALEFCPINPNILVGGCVNGQVVIWDISQKEKNLQKSAELSGEKLKYRLALHSFLGWTGSNNKYTFINPVLVSTLEYSSTSCITEIKWLSPYYKISHLGKHQDLKENGILSMQFMSCSQDGNLFIWDLQSKSRVKFGRKKPYQKQKSPLLKPLYKLFAENPTGSGHVPLTALTLLPFPISYVPQQQTHQPKILNVAQKLILSPEFLKPKMHPKNKIYIGSMEGEVMQATWSGYEFSPGETVNSEALKYKSRCDLHDGMVSSISISPFNKDLFLSIGGKVIGIWKDNVKDHPIFWRQSKVKLTHGTWSLLCPSMFYVTRVDGAFEVWDFVIRSDEPIMVQNISGAMLTGIYPSSFGLTQNLIGVADSSGIFHVFFTPCEHMPKDPKQKRAVTTFFNRETECRAFVKQCQDRWVELNAEMIQAQKEEANAMAKKKEIEKRVKERAEREKKKMQEEELERKKVRKGKGYMKEENARKKWHAEQEKYIIGSLLKKKKLNVDELLQKRWPLIKMEEEEQKKRSKPYRQPFLDIAQELQKAREKLVKNVEDLDSIVEKHAAEFKDKEEALLNFKNNNSFEYVINWKQLLVEGLEQRSMIDVTLYGNLERIDRYIQAKYERQIAMKSRYDKEHEEKCENVKQSMAKGTEPRQKKKLVRSKSDKKAKTGDTGKILDS